MDVKSALAFAVRVLAAWGVVEDLAPGEEGLLQPIRLKIGYGYWEVGPFPVRRLR